MKHRGARAKILIRSMDGFLKQMELETATAIAGHHTWHSNMLRELC